MTFSLPISINLVSNAILKGLINDSYSIKIAGQQLSTYDDFVYTDSTEQNALTVAIMFSFLSFSALTLFVLHPSREQALGLKHMQRMTGVSGFAYWFTIFIFDLFVFMLVVIVLLGSLLILDYTLNFDLYHLSEVGNNKKNMQKSLQEFKLDPITIQEYSSNLKKANEKAFLVANLGKKFNNNFSIKDINFEVDRNESFGIIGNNEAGKSAICNLISGKEVANSGTMFVDEINFRWSKREFFSKLAYCPQNNAHIDSLNAHDHLRLFARLRGIPENNIDAEVKKCIEKLNLSLCANQPSGTYSNDNQKRLNLAMALIGSPKVILFDEPTTNVEPETKNFIWNVIKACKTNGQTILLTSKRL
uniref:ABC transporter domain-containing protein n=1 Tax=Trichogramma kaykai TaxID=54128 RepID=A0ABD2X139_9HYME